MEAKLKSGKVVTGKLAETFVRIGVATEKKKRGNPDNLKKKVKKEQGEADGEES